MNPIAFALRHPITMMMLVVGLIGGGGLAIYNMRVDIFPPFDLPQIYVIQNFNGMSPGPDGRADRQPVRAEFPVRRRRSRASSRKASSRSP